MDYLALHVYKNDGKRVYYPRNPLVRGTYSNNPHALLRLDLKPGIHKLISCTFPPRLPSPPLFPALVCYILCIHLTAVAAAACLAAWFFRSRRAHLGGVAVRKASRH